MQHIRDSGYMNIRRAPALTFSLIALFFIVLMLPSHASGESERVTVTAVGGDMLVHPGEMENYTFRVHNNGTTSDRYLITLSIEYPWEGGVRQIVREDTGAPISFTPTETGVLTTEGIAPRKNLLVEASVAVPMLRGDEGWNRNNGLFEGEKATVSLWAYSMSDNFTSKGTDRFVVRMGAFHSAGIELLRTEEWVTTVGEESERIAIYPVSVTYLSNDGKKDNVHLSIVEGDSGLWDVFIQDRNFYIASPGQVFNTSVSVVAPVGEEWSPGPHNVTIRCEVDSGNGSEATTTTYLRKAAGVSLFADNTTIMCDPGEKEILPLKVQNLGNTEDVIALFIDKGKDNHWLTLKSNATDPLFPFELTTVNLSVLIPTEGAPPYGSAENFTVTALSNLSAGTKRDSLTIHVIVGVRRNGSISGIGNLNAVLLPSEKARFNVLMKNTGNLPEEIYLSIERFVHIDGLLVTARRGNWSVESSIEREYLEIGESAVVTLTVTVPDDGLLGENLTLTLRAVPTQALNHRQDFPFVNITVIVGNLTDIKIVPVLTRREGGPNETLNHTLIIQNHSDHNITLNLTHTSGLFLNISGADAGMKNWFWMPTPLIIRPYSNSTVYLFTRIPPRALAYTDFNLTVFIEGYFNTSAGIHIRVSQVYMIHLYFSGTSHKILPGRNTSYTLIIQNSGNGYDVVNLSVKNQVEHWNTTLEFTSISITPFSSRFIIVNVIAPAVLEYHGRAAEGARFLVNATSLGASDESYTPYTYLTILSVEPPSDPQNSYYTFDPDMTNDTFTLGTIHGYCYENRTITYAFTFMNLGEGAETNFVIPDIPAPPFMKISITMGDGLPVQDSFTAGDYTPIPLFLHITLLPITAPMNMTNEPLIFRINSPQSTASVYIYTDPLYLDLYFQIVDAPDEVPEGKEMNIHVVVNASAGPFPFHTYYEGIDYINDVRIVGYFDGERFFNHTIDRIEVGKSVGFDVRWRAPAMRWNEKERESRLTIAIKSYKAYQGDVERVKANNVRVNTITLRDASLADYTTVDAVTSSVILIILVLIEWLALTRFRDFVLHEKKTRKYLFPVFIVLFAILWGTAFNLPWHYFLSNANELALYLSYFTLFLVFPAVLYFVSKVTRSYGIVALSAIVILPVYLVAVSIGAGSEAAWDALFSNMLVSLPGLSFEFPVSYLTPLYFVFGMTVDYQMLRRYNTMKAMIEDIKRDLFRRMKETRRELNA